MSSNNENTENDKVAFSHITLQNSIPNFNELTRKQKNRIKNALSILGDPIKFLYYVCATEKNHYHVQWELIQDLCIASPYEFIPSNMFDPRLEECDEDGIYNLIDFSPDMNELTDNQGQLLIEMEEGENYIFNDSLTVFERDLFLDETDGMESNELSQESLEIEEESSTENDDFEGGNSSEINALFDELANEQEDGSFSESVKVNLNSYLNDDLLFNFHTERENERNLRNSRNHLENEQDEREMEEDSNFETEVNDSPSTRQENENGQRQGNLNRGINNRRIRERTRSTERTRRERSGSSNRRIIFNRPYRRNFI